MQVVRHSDAQAFCHRVDEFLLRNEVLHNIILGITSRLINQGETYEDVFLAHVENDAGDVLAVTMRTVPNIVILSEIIDKKAIALLVDALGEVYETLPGVNGIADDGLQFAELWKQKQGQDYSVMMDMGQYRLDKLIPPQNVNGQARPANQNDFEMLVDWLIKFSADTGMNTNYSREEAEKNITRKLEKPILGGISIWMDEGQAVSIASATRESENGGNVSLVYTPPEFRGRGYASAVTAHTSKLILDAGKSFCTLTTNLSYPTSNKIYQAIGYKMIGNLRHIEFKNQE